jgi:hypothetical protein
MGSHIRRRDAARSVSVWVAACGLLAVAACDGSDPAQVVVSSPAPFRTAATATATTATATAATATAATAAGDPTVVAAGDISGKRIAGQKDTSDLVLRLDPTLVLTLGDQQYNDGALADYRAYYDPTWGRFKAKTRPSPGNHDYGPTGADGYFAYFGTAAKPQGYSYYSFDIGGWHVVSLDSNIARDPGSAQLEWLRADLAATSKRCVLAYWHAPRFSSGSHHGNDSSVSGFWKDLYTNRADLVLNGHEHNYERFGPQNPQAVADTQGPREFVVGTGGNGLYPFGSAEPNSQTRLASTFGVLLLVLHPTSYEWKYVAVSGQVLDRGGPEACH